MIKPSEEMNIISTLITISKVSDFVLQSNKQVYVSQCNVLSSYEHPRFQVLSVMLVDGYIVKITFKRSSSDNLFDNSKTDIT